jgi:alpha-aminoadipic semialdehyde synthase
MFKTRKLLTLKKNPSIGIRREDKNVWERRTPLTPRHVRSLVQDGVNVFVQPSQIRCFPDKEYVKNGAKLSETLEETDTIFAVKEIPPPSLLPNKTYVFFSHTIKAQPKNMEMLETILNKNIRLLDYERITDENNKRLVRSGPFAGYAGTIDSLHILGERLLMEFGLSNPFTYLSFSRNYPDLATARNAVKNVGEMIAQYGLPKEISPLTFTVTGGATGSVAAGAKQILELLPHKYVKPEDLESFWANREFLSDHCIYIILADSQHYIEPIDKSSTFDKKHFYQNPRMY